MKSKYRTLLTILNDRVSHHPTKDGLKDYAERLTENHAKNIYAAVMTWAFGTLLIRLCGYGEKCPVELIQDAFPIITAEVDRAMVKGNATQDLFRDLRGEYSDEQVTLMRAITWNFICNLRETLAEIKVLSITIQKSSALSALFECIDMSQLSEMTYEEIEAYLLERHFSENVCKRLPFIIMFVIKEHPACFHDIFKKQELVLHNKLYTVVDRLGGTRAQLMLYEQCLDS